VHELGLLASVVTAVTKAAGDAGASSVEAVGLRVGTLSGAVPDALVGAWPIATSGTLLDGARLDLDVVAAQVWCPRCEAEREVDEFYALRCPACGTPTGMLVHGREFEVVWADLE
jgi:hydrogenase nickel incorporation protein HypA/HybF